MSVFLDDTFSGSGALDATKWSATPVSFLSGSSANLSQSGGMCLVANASNGEAWAVNAAPSADYSVTATIPALTGSSGLNEIDLGLRMIHVSTWLSGYYVILQNAVGGLAITMQKSTLAGGGGSVGTIGGVNVSTSFPCTVKFQAVGTTISVYVNGVLADSGTDTELTAAGRPYFHMANDVATHVELDELSWNNLGATSFWTDFIKTTEI